MGTSHKLENDLSVWSFNLWMLRSDGFTLIVNPRRNPWNYPRNTIYKSWPSSSEDKGWKSRLNQICPFLRPKQRDFFKLSNKWGMWRDCKAAFSGRGERGEGEGTLDFREWKLITRPYRAAARPSCICSVSAPWVPMYWTYDVPRS